MSEQDVVTELRNYIQTEFLDGEKREIANETPLFETGILESLRFFSLVSHIESHYGMQVPDAELTPNNFGTLSSIAKLVVRETSSRSAAGGR